MIWKSAYEQEELDDGSQMYKDVTYNTIQIINTAVIVKGSS